MADKTKRILVAEDDRPISKVLTLKLQHSGYEVVQAFDGEQAIDLLFKENFDLVLLDLIMPKKNGFDVLRELKEKGKMVNVIVTSNLSQEEDKKTVMELGAKDYFVKSNTPLAKIVEYVEQMLK
ncbi:MAG: response regulator [Patescibacteria group bacterium]|jgi:DNA-binding response OmpR family regulator